MDLLKLLSLRFFQQKVFCPEYSAHLLSLRVAKSRWCRPLVLYPFLLDILYLNRSAYLNPFGFRKKCEHMWQQPHSEHQPLGKILPINLHNKRIQINLKNKNLKKSTWHQLTRACNHFHVFCPRLFAHTKQIFPNTDSTANDNAEKVNERFSMNIKTWTSVEK